MRREVTSTMEVERGEISHLVTITGTYIPGIRGHKEHWSDPPEPDEPAEMQDVTAYSPNGEVALSEAEYEQASEKLLLEASK